MAASEGSKYERRCIQSCLAPHARSAAAAAVCMDCVWQGKSHTACRCWTTRARTTATPGSSTHNTVQLVDFEQGIAGRIADAYEFQAPGPRQLLKRTAQKLGNRLPRSQAVVAEWHTSGHQHATIGRTPLRPAGEQARPTMAAAAPRVLVLRASLSQAGRWSKSLAYGQEHEGRNLAGKPSRCGLKMLHVTRGDSHLQPWQKLQRLLPSARCPCFRPPLQPVHRA